MNVAVVTGGGGGIGAAIAEELGRQGAFVVTMDPLLSLDGSEQLPEPEEAGTAERIVAAGGSARATSVSVTDGDAVQALFAELVEEFGGLDAVVNVAGISRPTSFTRGTEDDWRAVLDVHLNGYRNVLAAALPLMAAAGKGRILGVTSGSGWRAADTGAYGCAKRAVAALTWQVGRHAPPGVVVNAISPIAVTRMVTAALGRAPASSAGASSATGGLNLGSMPQPEEIGPLGAHLVGEGFDWCSGAVIFAGGSEAAVIEPPRLLEVVRTGGATVLERFTPALVSAEASQLSGGGSNPRFPELDGAGELPSPAVETCAVLSDRPDVAAAVTAAIEARGVKCEALAIDDAAPNFATAAAALGQAVERAGALDAVVVAMAGVPSTGTDTWESILDEHNGIAAFIHGDASWARTVADYAAATERAVRLVTLSDAAGAGGRSRAQAAAQLARSSRKATDDRVAAFAVSAEGASADELGEVAAHLACSPDAVVLAGAELVVGAGWFGLRSHPRPTASVTLGGAELPAWFDDALREVIG